MINGRLIVPGADASKMGRGFFGVGKYLPIDRLELAHFFGTSYPDNKDKDCWDYSCNDRKATRNTGIVLGANSMSGGYYDLNLTAGGLGAALTIWGLFKRDSGKTTGHDGAIFSSYGGGSRSLTIAALAGTNGAVGRYQAFINGEADAVVQTVVANMDDYTGTGFELVALSVNGTGGANLYVLRPSGFTSYNTPMGNLITPGYIFGSGKFRAGKAYGGSFVVGDSIAAVGAYSRYLTFDEFKAVYAGLAAFNAAWGGPGL